MAMPTTPPAVEGGAAGVEALEAWASVPESELAAAVVAPESAVVALESSATAGAGAGGSSAGGASTVTPETSVRSAGATTSPVTIASLTVTASRASAVRAPRPAVC